MNVSELFSWGKPYNWPRDTATHIFLARAVNEVGRHRFPGEWTGGEASALLLSQLPQQISIKVGHTDRFFAHKDLAKSGRFPSLAPIPSKWAEGDPLPDFTESEWDAAVALRDQNRKAVIAAKGRLATVQQAISTALAEGHLVSALRDLHGGDFGQPEPPSIWNTEKYQERFSKCVMNRRRPFDPPNDSNLKGYGWIFLTRESLDRFLARPQPVSDEHSATYQSPYMRLMLAVSKKLDLSPENQLTKVVIERELIAMSKLPGMPRLSQTLLRYAATLMREPESQAGSASHHRRSKAAK